MHHLPIGDFPDLHHFSQVLSTYDLSAFPKVMPAMIRQVRRRNIGGRSGEGSTFYKRIALSGCVEDEPPASGFASGVLDVSHGNLLRHRCNARGSAALDGMAVLAASYIAELKPSLAACCCSLMKPFSLASPACSSTLTTPLRACKVAVDAATHRRVSQCDVNFVRAGSLA